MINLVCFNFLIKQTINTIQTLYDLQFLQHLAIKFVFQLLFWPVYILNNVRSIGQEIFQLDYLIDNETLDYCLVLFLNYNL